MKYYSIGVGTTEAPGAGAPLYFLKLTLCLHIRSLPTELEPPFIKPCSYAFVQSSIQVYNFANGVINTYKLLGTVC